MKNFPGATIVGQIQTSLNFVTDSSISVATFLGSSMQLGASGTTRCLDFSPEVFLGLNLDVALVSYT